MRVTFLSCFGSVSSERKSPVVWVSDSGARHSCYRNTWKYSSIWVWVWAGACLLANSGRITDVPCSKHVAWWSWRKSTLEQSKMPIRYCCRHSVWIKTTVGRKRNMSMFKISTCGLTTVVFRPRQHDKPKSRIKKPPVSGKKGHGSFGVCASCNHHAQGLPLVSDWKTKVCVFWVLDIEESLHTCVQKICTKYTHFV